AQGEWRAAARRRAEELLDECPEERRGWEWRYLKRLCHGELLTVPAGGPPAAPDPGRLCRALAFDPTGTHLAVGNSEGVLTVTNTETGAEQRRGRGHAGLGPALACSPDGQLLASCDQEGRLHLWDFRTGQRLRSCQGHTGPVGCLAFSRDGRQLASRGSDGSIRVWDPQTAECRQ